MNNITILKKFLNGNCSEEELKIVESLLETEEGNFLILQIMAEKDEYEEGLSSKTLAPNQKQKIQDWKRQVHKRIKANENKRDKIKKPFYSYLKAAIWSGFIISCSIFAYKNVHINKDNQLTSKTIRKSNDLGKPIKYITPDGSEIYLSAGSYIEYPEEFGSAERRIILSGEAFFEIKRNEKKPFIIQTGHIETKVLGTSFKISSFKESGFEITVATGKVQVDKIQDEHHSNIGILTPGMKLNYDLQNNKTSNSKIDITNIIQWKEGELIFENKSLQQVAKELERRFGKKIVFDSQNTANYRISASFLPEENFTQILNLLSEMGKFKFKKNNQLIYEVYKTENMNK